MCAHQLRPQRQDLRPILRRQLIDLLRRHGEHLPYELLLARLRLQLRLRLRLRLRWRKGLLSLAAEIVRREGRGGSLRWAGHLHLHMHLTVL